MDKHTYGDSKAAENLVGMLTGDKWLTKKVSGYWDHYTFITNELMRSEIIPSVKLYLLDLIFFKELNTVKISGMPPKIVSHLSNIMTGRRRQMMDDINELV